jgi:hypothetical protein
MEQKEELLDLAFFLQVNSMPISTGWKAVWAPKPVWPSGEKSLFYGENPILIIICSLVVALT